MAPLWLRSVQILTLLFGIVALAKPAHALTVTCTSANPDLILTYDTTSRALSLATSTSSLPTAPTAHFEVGSPTTLKLVDDSHATVATLEVLGHALKPVVNWLDPIGSKSSVGCALDGDAGVLFESLVTDPQMLAAISKWKAWLAKRPEACDPTFDSIGYFQPNANGKIALVFHGYSSNPRRMQAVIQVLLDAGYSVLAPRLSGHFNKSMKDLDLAKASAWEKDAENTFAVARSFGPQVTLVGYSLGGALASRLALAHADSIDKMILLAPAWRVTQGVNWASLIGTAFSISYNDWMKIPLACAADAGYTSAPAGLQVEHVGFDTDYQYAGQIDAIPMEYARLRVPHLIFTTPQDSVITSSVIDPICRTNFLYCTHVSVPNREHTTIELDLSLPAEGDFAHRSMADIATVFLTAPPPPPDYPQILDPALVPTR